MNEAQLMEAMGGRPGAVSQPCACGGVVVCTPGEIPLGVAAHQRMPEHVAWLDRGGMEQHAPADLWVPIERERAVA